METMDWTVETVSVTKPTAVLTVSATQLAAVEMVLETNPITSPTLLTNDAASAVFSTTADTTFFTLEKKDLRLMFLPPALYVATSLSHTPDAFSSQDHANSSFSSNSM
jgi:hypothetical protein